MSANLRDISSSSSGQESDFENDELQKYELSKPRQTKQGTAYKCPVDFVSCSYTPCESTCLEKLNSNDTELWLIKAPNNFNPECLSGLKIPRVGLTALTAVSGSPQVYSALSRPEGPSGLRLLTASQDMPGTLLCAPAFAGQLNICESFGNSLGNQVPVAIPACPAPRIPEGLRQRFHPFGSILSPNAVTKKPSREEPQDYPVSPKSIKSDPEEKEERRAWKKKDKRIKVKQEEDMTEVDPSRVEVSQQLEGGSTETKKKKKKKNRDKEKNVGELEPGLCIKDEVEVKPELVDLAYGDVEDSGKRKKKKKRHD